MLVLWLLALALVVAGLFALRNGRPVEPTIGAALVAAGLLVGAGGLNAALR